MPPLSTTFGVTHRLLWITSCASPLALPPPSGVEERRSDSPTPTSPPPRSENGEAVVLRFTPICSRPEPSFGVVSWERVRRLGKPRRKGTPSSDPVLSNVRVKGTLKGEPNPPTSTPPPLTEGSASRCYGSRWVDTAILPTSSYEPSFPSSLSQRGLLPLLLLPLPLLPVEVEVEGVGRESRR